MQKLYKLTLWLYLLLIAVLSAGNYAAQKYIIFIAESPGEHTLAPDGTLVCFDKIQEEDLELYDIILTGGENKRIARIMSIDKEKGIVNVVYDDFDIKEISVSTAEISGKLVFHINEVGNIYHMYLAKYKNIILMIPFFMLCASFCSYILYKTMLAKEDCEFEYHESLCRYKKHLMFYKSITVNKNGITESAYYDNKINPVSVPSFILDSPVPKDSIF